jgi:hypothetical protein
MNFIVSIVYWGNVNVRMRKVIMYNVFRSKARQFCRFRQVINAFLFG